MARPITRGSDEDSVRIPGLRRRLLALYREKAKSEAYGPLYARMVHDLRAAATVVGLLDHLPADVKDQAGLPLRVTRWPGGHIQYPPGSRHWPSDSFALDPDDVLRLATEEDIYGSERRLSCSEGQAAHV